jgi:hypothetical protein
MSKRSRQDTTWDFLNTPLAGGIITLLLLVVGGWGSVYSGDIKNAFPLHFGPYAGWSVPAVIFWVSVFLVTCLVIGRQQVIDSARKRDEMDLREFISTLPPTRFLEVFDKSFRVCLEARRSYRFQEEAIRVVLRNIAILAQHFDDAKIPYHANIMTFLPSGNLPTGEKVWFLDREADPKRLGGVLQLQNNLSATSESHDPDPDLPTKYFLPVPRPENLQLGEKWRVLPGAPRAYVTQGLFRIDDTRKIPDWCAERGDFTAEIRDEINRYFADAKTIRSVASFPLLSPTGFTSGGVVNVHCASAGILRSETKAKYFASVMEPFLALITDILGESGLREQESEAPA